MNIQQYRQRLTDLARDLETRLGRKVETARDTGDDQADPSDAARVQEIKDEFLAVAQSDTEILGEVRNALLRIDDGSYGRCIVDGGPIEAKRLEAVPWTPYCLAHQEELEQREQRRTPTM
jgi:DnaK suppressor protein